MLLPLLLAAGAGTAVMLATRRAATSTDPHRFPNEHEPLGLEVVPKTSSFLVFETTGAKKFVLEYSQQKNVISVNAEAPDHVLQRTVEQLDLQPLNQ